MSKLNTLRLPDTPEKPSYAKSALAAYDFAIAGELGGSLLYQARCAAALRKIVTFRYATDRTLEELPIDARTWQQIFTHPTVTAKLRYASARTGDQTISMVRSILRSYRHCIEPDPPTEVPAADDFSQFLEFVRASPEILAMAKLGPRGQGLLALGSIFALARSQGRTLKSVDRAWFDAQLVPGDDCRNENLKRTAKVLDRLRNVPSCAAFLLPAPLGALLTPGGRRRNSDLPVGCRPEDDPVHPALVSGSSVGDELRVLGRPRSEPTLKRVCCARKWYISALRECRKIGLETDLSPPHVARGEWVMELVRAEIEGRFSWKPLSASTLFGYLTYVCQWLSQYNPDLSVVPGRLAREHAFFDLRSRMSPANKMLCLAFLNDEAWQDRYFALPATLLQNAQDRLQQWQVLSGKERLDALRSMNAAALAAILTAVPFRSHSLRSIDKRYNIALEKTELGPGLKISLSRDQVKGGKKELVRLIHPRPNHVPYEMIQWYIGRPSELLRQSVISTPSENLLFLGMSWNQLSLAWRNATGKIGPELGLHQARHLLASFILHRYPDKLQYIAAVLGITSRSCEKYYAFIHEAARAAHCDRLLVDELSALRGRDRSGKRRT